MWILLTWFWFTTAWIVHVFVTLIVVLFWTDCDGRFFVSLWISEIGEAVTTCYYRKTEVASTHKSAKTHADDVFVTRRLDLWPFDSTINVFVGLTVEHFCVKFSDPNWIVFWDIVRKIRQTHGGENATPAISVGNIILFLQSYLTLSFNL